MSRHSAFFSLKESADLLGAPVPAGFETSLPLPQSFKIDSREVRSGDAFVACKGENTDGHCYIEAAVRAGASLVLAEASYCQAHADALGALSVPILCVSDTTHALAELARFWLQQVAPVRVGITGSVGKTTTREILNAILQKHFRTHSAIKSYNTLIGGAMTILAMPAETEVLILELGTNHPGEIEEMVRYYPITHGVITEAAPAHLEGLHSLEGVIRAKTELLTSDALAFITYNSDNSALAESVLSRAAAVRKIGVGITEGDIRVSNIQQSLSTDARPRLAFDIEEGAAKYACVSAIFGKQHARNIAYAYSVSRALGLEPESILQNIGEIPLPKGRGDIVKLSRGLLLIDESYNANPSSVSQAVKNVHELETDEGIRKIAILGGMRELGPESEKWHEVVVSRASLLDEVYLIGGEWANTETRQSALCGKWPDRESFARDFDFGALQNAVVLIKGSRYYALEHLIPLFEASRR